jgi:DNA-binding transcriptional regulator YiaG
MPWLSSPAWHNEPRCSNPTHLFAGTQASNLADCRAKGRVVQVRGERHGQAKLTDAEVEAIRSRAGTMSQVELAAIYGVHQSTIGRVISGERRALPTN